MNFLGIGPGELLLIFILALIVFGPRRLPEIGRSLGKTIREFREASQEFTDQFSHELQAASDELEAASHTLKGEKPKGSGESGTESQGLEG